MEWKTEYEIGIEEIDNQHKNLVEIIRDYNKTISDKDVNSSAQIGSVLVYLINYTSFHFESEESYMRKIGYPELNVQKELHKNIVIKLREILVKMKKKESYTPIEFYYFLMSWLNNHILDEDQKIGTFAKKHPDKLVLKKVILENPKSVLDVVPPNLKRIDLLEQKGAIYPEDSVVRKMIFIKDYYGKFLIEDSISFINIVKSILLLLEEGIISKTQKDDLINFLSIKELQNKFKPNETENLIINKLFI